MNNIVVLSENRCEIRTTKPVIFNFCTVIFSSLNLVMTNSNAWITTDKSSRQFTFFIQNETKQVTHCFYSFSDRRTLKRKEGKDSTSSQID